MFNKFCLIKTAIKSLSIEFGKKRLQQILLLKFCVKKNYSVTRFSLKPKISVTALSYVAQDWLLGSQWNHRRKKYNNLANFLPLGGSEIKTNHPRYWHCRSKGIEITDLLFGYNFNNKGKQIWFLKKFISHLWQAISPLAYST